MTPRPTTVLPLEHQGRPAFATRGSSSPGRPASLVAGLACLRFRSCGRSWQRTWDRVAGYERPTTGPMTEPFSVATTVANERMTVDSCMILAIGDLRQLEGTTYHPF